MRVIVGFIACYLAAKLLQRHRKDMKSTLYSSRVERRLTTDHLVNTVTFL